jgi:Domain of unknown function (DUF4160)
MSLSSSATSLDRQGKRHIIRITQTILRIGPYRFYFYSHEPNEPPHIHIDRDTSSAKFWLELVNLASNIDFSAKELRKLQSIVQENQKNLLEAWYGYFGNSGGRES